MTTITAATVTIATIRLLRSLLRLCHDCHHYCHDCDYAEYCHAALLSFPIAGVKRVRLLAINLKGAGDDNTLYIHSRALPKRSPIVLCWRPPAFTMVPRFAGGLPPLQNNRESGECIVGGLPPLQWSPVLLAASRLYTGPRFRWRPLAFTVVIRFVGGLPPLQWSPVLLVASAFTYMLANVVEWLAQIMTISDT